MGTARRSRRTGFIACRNLPRLACPPHADASSLAERVRANVTRCPIRPLLTGRELGGRPRKLRTNSVSCLIVGGQSKRTGGASLALTRWNHAGTLRLRVPAPKAQEPRMGSDSNDRSGIGGTVEEHGCSRPVDRSRHQRSLQDQRAHRARRHGQGLPGRAGPPRARLRHQGAQPQLRRRARPGVPQALLPRGEHRVEADPPQHGDDLRLRPDRRRHLLHGDGVPGGAHAPPGHPRGRPLPRGARGPHRSPDLPRAARGALARRHPPRPQARQHLPGRARRRDRLREGPRLRPREERLRRRQGRGPDADGPLHGQPQVHGARADPRRQRRRAHGHLRARHHHVRDDHGQGAVRPAQQRQHPDGARERRGAAPPSDEPEHERLRRRSRTRSRGAWRRTRTSASARWTRCSPRSSAWAAAR